MRRLGADVAILAITHRPAFLEIADRVYHLEGGQVETPERELASASQPQG